MTPVLDNQLVRLKQSMEYFTYHDEQVTFIFEYSVIRLLVVPIHFGC